MKTLQHSILLTLLCIFFQGWSQVLPSAKDKIVNNVTDILTIFEDHKKGPKEIKKHSSEIIDINGNLEIHISKDALIKKIHNNYPLLAKPLELQEKINRLEIALEDQDKLYRLLALDIRSAENDNQLNAAFLKFMNSITNTNLENQFNSLYNEWDVKYGNNDNPPFGFEFYILREFNSNLSNIHKELNDLDVQQFHISMLAFLKNKQGGNRVHIKNFDTYSEREFFRVERWITNLSEEQHTKLKDITERTKVLNDSTFSFFANLKTEILERIPKLKCIENSKNDIDNFLKNSKVKSNITTALRNDIDALLKEYNGLASALELIKGDVSNLDITTPFSIIEQVRTIISMKDKLRVLLKSFKQTAAVIVNLKIETNTIIVKMDTCYNDITSSINALVNELAMLKNQQNRYVSNKEIGEDVFRFTLDNLPETGTIKLEGSGRRVNGDIIEIELVLLVPDSTNSNSTINDVLESRALTMQLIGLRSETVVGVIFTDSFNEKGFIPVSNRRFLYAPSAALLLKVGSRNSKIYNEFIDIGFGIGVSSPDFNTDGTNEFGLGFMLTAFKDIISVGINYNVTLDTPFWSFGINLPFNLPGIPINKPK